MKRMGELITAIENAGVQVIRASWLEDGHLDIVTDPKDHEKAEKAARDWHMKQAERSGLQN
ncbi:hypothetical protein PAECIP111893_02419 [Paenibacillus plantiphilus]|uniref:Uncharacterized protein n=1 Tax=Paenibacillus plantiphilus TaxID=2905650 RepID=A0ABN8GGJ9_9BACL|nr:hypothetical protein [Paenibacillus plantiphilus]CAH1205790.1 hypothetical protein PAECIP111893_02419 [Paenibacillus plantiphilus]